MIILDNNDFRSGSVCLDVINQTWSPMFGNDLSLNLLTKYDFVPSRVAYGGCRKMLHAFKQWQPFNNTGLSSSFLFWNFFGLLLYVKICFLPDLVNVFEVFLPQLLLYPNPSDPLNGEAAALMMRDRPTYDQRVKGIVDPLLLTYSYTWPS